MIDVDEVKRNIINYLQTVGPSIPVRIAKQIKLSPVFSSAILSELVYDRKIKTSNLRMGSSPFYFIPGDEKKLEEFADNLSGVEKTAYLKLKQSIILEDEKQEPSIRVALRSIKDFAIAIRFQEKIFWKYAFATSEEINELLKKTEQKLETPPQKNHEENILHQKKPLLEIKTKKRATKKIPEEFLNEIREYLEAKDIELLEIIETKKTQVIGKIRINSDLGKLSYLLIAKDKKRPSLNDLTTALKEANHEKMPCYIISRGGPASTTKEFLEENKNLLKIDTL